MSFIKRILEQQQEEQELVDAVNKFIEDCGFDYDAARGIAEIIAKDRSTDNLSPDQMEVYKKYILPKL